MPGSDLGTPRSQANIFSFLEIRDRQELVHWQSMTDEERENVQKEGEEVLTRVVLEMFANNAHPQETFHAEILWRCMRQKNKRRRMA